MEEIIYLISQLSLPMSIWYINIFQVRRYINFQRISEQVFHFKI